MAFNRRTHRNARAESRCAAALLAGATGRWANGISDPADERFCVTFFRESKTAVVSASGAVFSARTISHSFITLAGEKKWRPTTSSGREVTAAISSMLR